MGRRELKGRWKAAAGCCRAEPAAGSTRTAEEGPDPPVVMGMEARGEKIRGERSAHCYYPTSSGTACF